MHSPAAGGTALLVGATKSEACLTCHEKSSDTGPNGYHISTAGATVTGQPLQRTPGGDFGWLKKTFSWLDGTVTKTESDTHGHNIIAPVNGYAVDSRNATAPGGTFQSANLACNSCHDPHGKYRRLADGSIATSGKPIMASGSYDTSVEPTADNAVGVYRLLAGNGYTSGGMTYTGVPMAKAPSTYNRTESSSQTRVAYGSATSAGHVTWSTWCSTCHPDMHSSGNYVHPTDAALGSTISGLYGSYVKSGDLTGTAATSYLTLVPFVEGGAVTYATLAGHAKNDNTQLGGPATTDQVACLSCHRAHASGYQDMLRFDYGYEFITKNGQYVATDHPDFATWGSRAPLQARGRTIADVTAANYDRPATKFASYQRVLCNKCHAKD
jgi:hypothetical protein